MPDEDSLPMSTRFYLSVQGNLWTGLFFMLQVFTGFVMTIVVCLQHAPMFIGVYLTLFFGWVIVFAKTCMKYTDFLQDCDPLQLTEPQRSLVEEILRISRATCITRIFGGLLISVVFVMGYAISIKGAGIAYPVAAGVIAAVVLIIESLSLISIPGKGRS